MPGHGKQRRLRRLKNDFQQGSVLVPLLFNTYISDLPTTISRKYAYADDLAIMYADGDWLAVEGVLSKGMATVSEHLQTRKLKFGITKTVSAIFYLKNKEAKRELKVNHNNETLCFCSEPNTSEWCWTGRSRNADTLSHFAKTWHHASHSWGGLQAPLGVLEQQRWEQLGPFNSRVLLTCLVPQYSHPPHWPRHRRFANCGWMPARDGTGQHFCSPARPELIRNRPARLC